MFQNESGLSCQSGATTAWSEHSRLETLGLSKGLVASNGWQLQQAPQRITRQATRRRCRQQARAASLSDQSNEEHDAVGGLTPGVASMTVEQRAIRHAMRTIPQQRTRVQG
jgi:hypothetical protein